MIKKKMLMLLLSMSLIFALSMTMAEMARVEVTADTSDKDIALQLDQQAKQFIISGDFTSALEKFQAAEIMFPDAGRTQRIEKLQSFVDIRKGFKPPASPQAMLSKETKNIVTAPPLPVVMPSDARQPVANEEERRVRIAIDAVVKFLHDYADDAAELIMSADYQLTQSGESFLAEFAEVKLRFDNNNYLDTGKLKLILKPDSNNKIHFVVKLNDTFKAIEKDKIIAELTMDDHDIQGIWNEQLEIFEDVNAIIKNPIVSVKGTEAGTIRADEWVFVQKLNRLNTDNKWQQSIESYLTNFQLEVFNRKQKREALFKLDAININASVSGRDFERIIALRKELQEKSLDLTGDLSLEQNKTLMKSVQKQGLELFSLLDFYDTSAVLKGLSAIGPEGEGELSLKEISLSFSAGAKEKDNGELKIHLIGSQISASGIPGMPPGVVPDNFEFNLSVENFPSGISNIIREMSENPGKEEQIARRFGESLQKNKSKIVLNKAALSFTDYAMTMNANAIANVKSPFLSTGEASMSLLNFPLIIEKAKQFGTPMQVNMMLSAVAMASVRSEENGKTKDQFDLIWTADGKVLLNGKDAMALMADSSKPPAEKKSEN